MGRAYVPGPISFFGIRQNPEKSLHVGTLSLDPICRDLMSMLVSRGFKSADSPAHHPVHTPPGSTPAFEPETLDHL